MNLDTNTILLKAIQFANWAHRDQKQKTADTPYIVHPFHTMLLLTTYGVTAEYPDGCNTLVAAVLQESIKDNPAEVTSQLVQDDFGSAVATIVDNLTPNVANPNKKLYRTKILGCHWTTRIVRVAAVLNSAMALKGSIKSHGLERVEALRSESLAEWIEMEKEFLARVCGGKEPKLSLQMIRDAAIIALAELEALLPKK